MNEQPIVHVIDDDPAARESVSALVTSSGFQVETYSSAEMFLQQDHSGQPGCVVTDLRMLGMSGVELLERIQQSPIPIPVVLISAFADVPVAVRAMSAGAVSLLEKPCPNEQLLSAIQKAIDLDASQRVIRSRKLDIRNRLAELTIEEHEVMQRMVAGKLNKVIASELLISLRTVETRRHKVLEKMRADSLAELVRMVVEVGA